MPRFFFHLSSGQCVHDLKGEECATVHTAIRLGKVIAEELARNSYLRGKLLIEDSHGATVCELPVER
jgi:hypothetical protein